MIFYHFNGCGCFNPRSRVGSDHAALAKAFEATQFQSTLPRGERHKTNQSQNMNTLFQSTLPRGERLIIAPKTKYQSCFNPRSRVGSDI